MTVFPFWGKVLTGEQTRLHIPCDVHHDLLGPDMLKRKGRVLYQLSLLYGVQPRGGGQIWWKPTTGQASIGARKGYVKARIFLEAIQSADARKITDEGAGAEGWPSRFDFLLEWTYQRDRTAWDARRVGEREEWVRSLWERPYSKYAAWLLIFRMEKQNG